MLTRIRQKLELHCRVQLPERGKIPAAVLVPLFFQHDELCLLMEHRTEQVECHKGEISFPGGVRDPNDRDSINTALREAWEEVGLKPDDVQVLGILDDLYTITGFRITPVVGWIPFPYDFRISKSEVCELLVVPLRLFSQERACHYVEYKMQKQKIECYYFKNHQIWGASARIARGLTELLEKCTQMEMEAR